MDSVINVVRSAKLEKGELRKDEAGQYDEFAAREMTFAAVRKLCRERGSYSVPSSNTILYLHQNKFRNIAGLEKFTACKVLHLENNCIFKVEGISQLVNLRVLHLQSNAISVVEGLEACTNLDTLNISSNPIRDLQGLPESLRTLNAARCGLSHAISLKHIAEMCPRLQVLDLQHNALGGEEAIEALSGLSEARVLYLQGNHLASLPSYRRRLITSLADLSYLDDRPVDDIERVGAAAWSTGGVEAERAARQAYRDAKRNAERRSVTSFALERAARQAMRESLQLVGLQTSPHSEDSSPTDTAVQHRIVASDAAVESLPIRVLSSIPAEASECAVCSDAFSVGDATSQLPCNHIFHTSCIRPWLLSFSNSCPLCRQTIGGESHETFLGPGSQLAPLISDTLMQRLVRPASAPVRRNRNNRREEAPCREGCPQLAVAPPWSAVGGAFTATDLVRHHAMQDNMASGNYGNSDVLSGPPVEELGDAPSDIDPEQLRFREKINDLCRRNVGTKSREAESKLAAWNLMKLNKEIRDHPRDEPDDESAASAQITSAPCSKGATPLLSIEIPPDSINNAAENTSNEASVGAASDVEMSEDSPHQPSSGGSSNNTAKDGSSLMAWGSPKSEAPGDDERLPTSTMASEASLITDDISPAATSDSSPTPRSGASSRTPIGATEADLVREKLRVERMLRFYANLNEERKKEQERMAKAAAAAAEAMAPPVEESLEDGDHDADENAGDQQQPYSADEHEGGLNDVVLSAAGERMMSTAAAVLSLPTGGVTLDGGDDLWDLGGDITVSSMPYM